MIAVGMRLLFAAGVLAAGAVILEGATPAHAVRADPRQSPAAMPCVEEDGSGQLVCVWDARHAGNGCGRSFVAYAGGTDDARYLYVSHRVAHRALAGGVR